MGPNKVMTCKSHMDCNGAFVSIISIYVGLQTHKSAALAADGEDESSWGYSEEEKNLMHVFRDERESDWACQVLCCRYTEMGCMSMQ